MNQLIDSQRTKKNDYRPYKINEHFEQKDVKCFFHEKFQDENYLNDLIEKKINEDKAKNNGKAKKRKLHFKNSESLNPIQRKIKKRSKNCIEKGCNGNGNFRYKNSKSHFTQASCPVHNNKKIEIDLLKFSQDAKDVQDANDAQDAKDAQDANDA